MQKQSFLKKHKKIIQIVLILFVLVFLGVMTYFIGRPLVRFMSNPENFKEWVSEKGVWGILAFVGMVVFQVIIAIIPGGPFQIGAGYAFGVIKGSLLCDVATTIGSVLIFLLVRRFGMDFIELFVKKEKIESIRFLKSSRKSENILFLIFLIPGTPKDLISYLVGLTDIRLSRWIFICFFGRFPAIFLSALSGSAIRSEQYGIGIAAGIATAVFYIIGIVVYHHHNRKEP